MAPCTPHPLDPLLINAHLMSVDLGLAQMHVTYFIIMFLHLSVILFTRGGGRGRGSLSREVSVRGRSCPRWSLSRGVSVWGRVSVQVVSFWGRGLCPGGLFLGGGVSVQCGRGASVQVVSF